MRNDPPENARQRRWWIFLSQFRLNIFHIPGAKNEFCDMLSREGFQERFQADSEELARQAFQRMDIQLDLRLEAMAALGEMSSADYQDEYASVWGRLSPHKAMLIDQQMFYRDDQRLWVEKKLALPK